MFNIPAGEYSPRVTLLQILLNSHGCLGKNGKRLTVDGVYGGNTRAAVAAASHVVQMPSDLTGSAATSVLVGQLLANVDLLAITSVDLGDPALRIDVDAFRSEGNDPIVLGGMCNGLQQMMSLVIGRSQPHRVAALRFDGHGNLGRWLTISVGDVVHLGRNEYRDVEAEIMSYISSSNFNKVSGVVAPLNDIFAQFGFVEHLGCTLGARRATREMLRRLANLWGVPIRVGLHTQPIGSTNILGPAFTAFPGTHSLRSWSHQFDRLDLPGRSQSR